METQEKSIDPILQALAKSGSIGLAELVKQKDSNVSFFLNNNDFRLTLEKVAEKVKVLRAGGSVDPERWLKRAVHLLNQKNFVDVSSFVSSFSSTVTNEHFQALFCYKKAKDLPGAALSQACLHEQEARTYRAAGDDESATACFERAITIFLDIGYVDQAASCYELLGQFGKVAGLL
jgi:tetratricopeptide (TPR) repeat protein